MRPVSRKIQPARDKIRLPPLMVGGLMLLSSCGGETYSGKVVDGERNGTYSFEVNKGDILFKRNRTGFLNRKLGRDMTAIKGIGPSGVVLDVFGNHEVSPIKPRILVAGSVTIPFGMCEGLIPSDYLVRFDERGGKTYLTMIEKVDWGNIKNSKGFSSVPDPCKP
jgi:hypothetical protein